MSNTTATVTAAVWTVWGAVPGGGGGSHRVERALAKSVTSVQQHLPELACVVWMPRAVCPSSLEHCERLHGRRRPAPVANAVLSPTKLLRAGRVYAVGGFPPHTGIRSWTEAHPHAVQDVLQTGEKKMNRLVGRAWLHQMLLPLGVRAAIYLDTDATVVHPQAVRLLQGPPTPPLVVAARCSPRSLKKAERFIFGHPLVRVPSRARLFNNGVLGFPSLESWRDAFRAAGGENGSAWDVLLHSIAGVHSGRPLPSALSRPTLAARPSLPGTGA